MDYEKIFTSTPINRTAAFVTQQGREEETERQYLVKQVQYLTDAIKSAKIHKNIPLSEVKRMGIEKIKIQERIRELKDHKKKKMKTSIHFYFMEECRTHLHPLEFQKILKKALDKREEAEKNDQ